MARPESADVSGMIQYRLVRLNRDQVFDLGTTGEGLGDVHSLSALGFTVSNVVVADTGDVLLLMEQDGKELNEPWVPDTRDMNGRATESPDRAACCPPRWLRTTATLNVGTR
jgi:hypothetical protein